jgi:glycosyltransferase involved in cell wall biosynthesis
MKIAVISNTSWNILNFRLGLIEALQEQGHDLIYYAPYDNAVKQIAEQNPVPHRSLKHLQRKGYNPIADARFCYELYKAFKEDGIELVLNYTVKPNIYGSIAARLAGIKNIATVTGVGYLFIEKSFMNKIGGLIYQYGLRFADKVAFQNKIDKDLFEKNGICDIKKSLLINGSGINLRHYRPAEVPPPETPFVFLFVARLLYVKGIKEFIAAAERLHAIHPSIEFHLVGPIDKDNYSAVTEEELQGWLKANPQLRYFGKQNDVRSFIQAAHCVVLPSYREGIPRVLLESMALEKPFVTTNCAGCIDVTTHGENGLMAEMGSVDSLFDAMNTMQALPLETRQAMGKKGRHRVETLYDEKFIIDDYFQLILSLS